MRQSRAKRYRKQVAVLQKTFGFRSPFQVLYTGDYIATGLAQAQDPILTVERTLQVKIKPMISQCAIEELYKTDDKVAIAYAKQKCERRLCNHLPVRSTRECIESLCNPRGTEGNKFRYCVVTQDGELRELLRLIPGVPLIYSSRSVVIFEPLSPATLNSHKSTEIKKLFHIDQDERERLNLGSKDNNRKRSTTELESSAEQNESVNTSDQTTASTKKKRRGPKQPNPLSIKKKKPKVMKSTNEKITMLEKKVRRRTNHNRQKQNQVV